MSVPTTQPTQALQRRTAAEPEVDVQPIPSVRGPARRMRGRTVLLLGALFGLVVLLAVLFGPTAQPVDTALVEPAHMVVTVSSEGKTRVKQQYDVAAPVAGRLRRIPLKAGDDVVANETVVATIDPPAPQFNDMRSQAELTAKVKAAESALAQAQADLVRARAQLDFAEHDVTRYQDLAARGVTAQRSMSQYVMEAETRRSAMVVANKLVEQRVAELESAKALLVGPDASGSAQPGRPVDVRARRTTFWPS